MLAPCPYPCSCTFGGQVPCADGRIAHINMGNQGLPASGGIPLALLDLTGLQHLGLGHNNLQGTIPDALGKQLHQLTYLDLGQNALTGTVPASLTSLEHLTYIAINRNPHLTGVLPAFNFSQFTGACVMSGDNFTCPLPAGAATCDHWHGSKHAPPTCK